MAINWYSKLSMVPMLYQIYVSYACSNNKFIFSGFSSIESLYNYIQSTPVENRCYFEVIFNRRRKPYFDIDIPAKEVNDNGVNIINTLITSLIKVLNRLYSININISDDILIFSSNGEDKYSYHVIVDNYCVLDNTQCKIIYQEVIKLLPDNIIGYIDNAVYNSTQQFRMLWSHKPNSTRIKIMNTEWRYNNTIIRYNITEPKEQLKHSLITLCDKCRPLEEINTSLPIKSFPAETYDVADIKSMLNDEVKIRDIRGNIVILQRVKPSYCVICNRMHDRENPYLLILNGKVRYYCRRGDKNYVVIGKIGNDNDD